MILWKNKSYLFLLKRLQGKRRGEASLSVSPTRVLVILSSPRDQSHSSLKPQVKTSTSNQHVVFISFHFIILETFRIRAGQ